VKDRIVFQQVTTTLLCLRVALLRVKYQVRFTRVNYISTLTKLYNYYFGHDKCSFVFTTRNSAVISVYCSLTGILLTDARYIINSFLRSVPPW